MNKFLWKLEQKIRPIAITNLMFYIVALNALVFVLSLFFGGAFLSRLYLIPYYVMQGEVWRLFTFIFTPPTNSLIFIIFALYFYYMIGSTLERQWGTAKFNLYYFIGFLGTIIGSFLTGAPATSTYLNLSLFLAFAHIFPDFQVLLFLMIPVKMKYLAYLNWFFFGFTIIFGSMGERISALMALVNFFLFFYQDFIGGVKRRTRTGSTRQNFNQQVREFRKRR
ncbi:MAG TPA: hypothetical protein DHN33_08835 [Eubacteriaceae bacterium]|nr:hypothetical protein [Eubacteriaceae bacterium]